MEVSSLETREHGERGNTILQNWPAPRITPPRSNNADNDNNN
jgi:hypothetical protein